MYQLLTRVLFICACGSAGFAQPADPSGSLPTPSPPPSSASPFASVSFYALYVDEVFENGDEGDGGSFEAAAIISAESAVFFSLGLEIAYIESDSSKNTALVSNTRLIGYDPSTELALFFLNYKVSGAFEDTGFVWEAGAGFGFMSIDLELDDTGGNRVDDSDVVGAVQLFGRLGYEFADGMALFAGLRNIDTGEAELFGAKGSVLEESVAFDLSFRLLF